MIFCGEIYCVTCLVNGKMYIGQTIYSFKNRWKRHIQAAERGSGNKFHRAIRKYGPESFLVEKVLTLSSPTKELLKEKLDYVEIRLISKFDTKRHGYNATDGGEGIINPSKEALLKISKALKGRKFSEETLKKMSDAAKLRVGPLNSNFGNHKLAGINHPLYGKHHSVETREKISKARKGHKGYITNNRKVFQYSLDGELVKVWDTVKEAKTVCGLRGHKIRIRLADGLPYKGYIWKDESKIEANI